VQVFLGGGSWAFIFFLEARGDYIYSTINYERIASFFGDPDTLDARTICLHRMRGKAMYIIAHLKELSGGWVVHTDKLSWLRIGKKVTYCQLF
jgi:hypothetical protein